MCCKNNLETELGRQFILGVITQPSILGSRLRTEPAQLRPLSATTVLAPSGSYAGPHNPESFATPPQRIGILGSRSPAVGSPDGLAPRCCSSRDRYGSDNGNRTCAPASFRDHLRIGRIAVHIDHARAGMTRS